MPARTCAPRHQSKASRRPSRRGSPQIAQCARVDPMPANALIVPAERAAAAVPHHTATVAHLGSRGNRRRPSMDARHVKRTCVAVLASRTCVAVLASRPRCRSGATKRLPLAVATEEGGTIRPRGRWARRCVAWPGAAPSEPGGGDRLSPNETVWIVLGTRKVLKGPVRYTPATEHVAGCRSRQPVVQTA